MLQALTPATTRNVSDRPERRLRAMTGPLTSGI
jgi:hypothetical protein